MLYHDFLKKKLLDIINSKTFEKPTNSTLCEWNFNLEIPNNKKFGDISTNIAMVLSKSFQTKPRDLATRISNELKKNDSICKLEVVGPGFINIFFKDWFWHDQLKKFLDTINKYNYGIKKKSICLEYVSANPTGLMHIGHARGAILGDTIASILEEVGFIVNREYYINDAGEQIKKLTETLLFHNSERKNENLSEELYPGKYLKNISEKLLSKINNSEVNRKDLECKAIELIMNDIKEDLLTIKVNHDTFTSEKEVASEKNIDQIKEKLNKKKLSYYGYQEKPKSLDNNSWIKKKQLLFKSKELGDDSDRALLKPDGTLTYFMSDIIYHQKKIDDDYDILLNIWGVDHSGYVKRLENVLSELNKEKKFNLKIKLTAMVNLLEGNKVVKMSKREGNYVTLREVVDKVGADVLRFMMITRSSEKKIDFDFNLVKSKTKDNPVFYVQYAYARCMSLKNIYMQTFDKEFCEDEIKNLNFECLDLEEEKNLIKKVCNFHNIVISSAVHYEPHRVTNFLYDLAKDFHAYWGIGKVDELRKIILKDDISISKSRLALCLTISKVIKKGMDILKINCPESM